MSLEINNQQYKSFAGFGVDVAIKRTDDLDKIMLEHLRSKSQPKVLDLGCGAGGQSLRMVKAGAIVTAIDVYDFSVEFSQYRQQENIDENVLNFICADINDLSVLLKDEIFDDVSIQRTLHYLPYQSALATLQFLRKVVKDKLFISVTGMDSAVGENYLGKDLPMESRFVKLDTVEADIFQIQAPICLYREGEFVELLGKSGWRIERVWSSAFGNLKAVCN